jgi:hypothetical protein
MIVVQPTETRHEIKIVPRYYPTNSFTLLLYNEATKVNTTINIVVAGFSFTNNYSVLDGYLNLKFDKEFNESDKYKITLKEENEVIYRGKIKATSQEPQEYKQTKDKYYYE